MNKKTPNVYEFFQAVIELQQFAEQTFGVFHDTVHGWIRLSLSIEGLVQIEMSAKGRAPSCTLIHGKGNPAKDPVSLHTSTLGEALDRCRAHGPSEVFLAGMCLASIYAKWEDHSRQRMADALCIKKNAVRSELFADLSRIRHIIMHGGSKADKDFSKCTVLTWFKPATSSSSIEKSC